jgi:hypothetical protein
MSDHLTEKLSTSQELDVERAKLDLEAVLRFPQGKRVVVSILERCGVYRSAYSGEASPTDFRLGEQNIGLWLISQIEGIGPMEYPTLLMERARMAEEKRIAVVDEE